MDPNLLFDQNTPFTGPKLQALETFVAMMNSGDPAKMAQAREALENLRENTNFWLQTDSVIQHSQQVQTVFFALVALHAGVKVS